MPPCPLAHVHPGLTVLIAGCAFAGGLLFGYLWGAMPQLEAKCRADREAEQDYGYE